MDSQGFAKVHIWRERAAYKMCVKKHTVGEKYLAKRSFGNWRMQPLGPNSGEKVSKWAAGVRLCAPDGGYNNIT